MQENFYCSHLAFKAVRVIQLTLCEILDHNQKNRHVPFFYLGPVPWVGSSS